MRLLIVASLSAAKIATPTLSRTLCPKNGALDARQAAMWTAMNDFPA